MPRRTFAVLSALALAGTVLAACADDNNEPGERSEPKATLQATPAHTGTQLSWQWTLRNDDSTPIVILDGPVTNTSEYPQVWITPGKDDTVEVAYRFLAPPDGVDVVRPILQAGHTIDPGASTSGTAQVKLPLAVRHPYAGAFDPPLALPGGDPDVRFCIGVVSTTDVTAQPGGAYAHLASAVTKQRIICAES